MSNKRILTLVALLWVFFFGSRLFFLSNSSMSDNISCAHNDRRVKMTQQLLRLATHRGHTLSSNTEEASFKRMVEDVFVKSVLEEVLVERALEEDKVNKVLEEDAVRRVLEEAPWLQRDTCSPVKNIAFLKTHKCASSTIQNMLMRYGEKHDLTFAMPKMRNFFLLLSPFNASLVHGDAPFHTDKVNIFAMHAVWNTQEVSKVLYPNPTFFTIVRDPKEVFVSMFDYFAFERYYGMTLETFVAVHGIEMKRFMGCLSYNIIACDMGALPRDYINPKAIKLLTHQIDHDFDLVLVAERFEESLVLMKHLLCWSYEDVIWLNVNARYKKKDRLTPVVSDMLSDRLKPDYFIYKHFTKKFDLIVKAFGEERMAVEVKKLLDITKAKLDECNIVELKPKTVSGPEAAGPAGKVSILNTNSTDPMCLGIIRPEVEFVNRLKKQQAAALANKNKLISP